LEGNRALTVEASGQDRVSEESRPCETSRLDLFSVQEQTAVLNLGAAFILDWIRLTPTPVEILLRVELQNFSY
jgi:hypothetical protein